jgi:hypothetical protein
MIWVGIILTLLLGGSPKGFPRQSFAIFHVPFAASLFILIRDDCVMRPKFQQWGDRYGLNPINQKVHFWLV